MKLIGGTQNMICINPKSGVPDYNQLCSYIECTNSNVCAYVMNNQLSELTESNNIFMAIFSNLKILTLDNWSSNISNNQNTDKFFLLLF